MRATLSRVAIVVLAGAMSLVSLNAVRRELRGKPHARAFADSASATFGGHLMPGSIVYTTAEIVIGELEDVTFAREPNSTFGYQELAPRTR